MFFCTTKAEWGKKYLKLSGKFKTMYRFTITKHEKFGK